MQSSDGPGWRLTHKHAIAGMPTIGTGGPIVEVEHLTVTMPAEMLAVVKAALSEGDYAYTSEVIRETPSDWNIKRALQLQEFVALKQDSD